MNFCTYCTEPCGQREFCDETCYGEYKSEMNALEDGVRDYSEGGACCSQWGEPEEWEAGGL